MVVDDFVVDDDLVDVVVDFVDFDALVVLLPPSFQVASDTLVVVAGKTLALA